MHSLYLLFPLCFLSSVLFFTFVVFIYLAYFTAFARLVTVIVAPLPLRLLLLLLFGMNHTRNRHTKRVTITITTHGARTHSHWRPTTGQDHRKRRNQTQKHVRQQQ